MKKIMRLISGIFALIFWINISVGLAGITKIHAAATVPVENTGYVHTIRIVWQPIPSAVTYKLAIVRKTNENTEEIITVKNNIAINGYELDTSVMGSAREYYWKVCPLNLIGEEMGPYTEAMPLANCEFNPEAPLVTTEFEKMVYSPLYPVYSWIPNKAGKSYEVKIYRENPGKRGDYQVVRSIEADSYIFYDNDGFTNPGRYYWQVRSKDKSGKVNSNWSAPNYFTVSDRTEVAALGDSITHGGGACTTPPGYAIYAWETYCKVPIKNLGFSGDTVQAMEERFERDVLSFHPRILVIMGGVNNFREGYSSWEAIESLRSIRAKCHANNIIPIFVTATPINPSLMTKVSTIEHPVSYWKSGQQAINEWVLAQPYHVDVTPRLTDKNGWLKVDMTTDGLHPDMEGKKLIGEAIGKYLTEFFPSIDLQ